MLLTKVWLGAALIVVACITIHGEEEMDVISLDDNNFEHLTQASSGATTGDWLVMMTKDKKCPDCDNVEKELRKVAILQKGRMNIAKLDPQNSRLTLRRFKVPKKPTLIFFRLGMQWTYKSDLKKKKINEFISDGYTRQNGHRVTLPLDSIDVWKDDFIKEIKAAYKEKRLPERNVLLLSLTGLLVGFMLIFGFAFSKDKVKEKKK